MMWRKDLVRRIAEVMREKGIRKSVTYPKHVFHVSDDEGNRQDFKVKQIDKTVLYTAEDIEAMLDTMTYVIGEALRRGEDVSLVGFGRFGVKYRPPRTFANNLNEGEMVSIPGRYYPYFTVGNDLVRCAQVYDQSLKDMATNAPPPPIDYDEFDDEEEI